MMGEFIVSAGQTLEAIAGTPGGTINGGGGGGSGVQLPGRLKVEPWLEQRVGHPNVRLHPRTELVSATGQPGQALHIGLTNGDAFAVDDILLATGYQVEMPRLPFLWASQLQTLRLEKGFPAARPCVATARRAVRTRKGPLITKSSGKQNPFIL